MNFRKLARTLSLVAIAMVVIGTTALSASANCLASIQIIDMATGEVHQGFVSCGSSAGNYIADLVTGWSGDTESADMLCDLVVC